MESLSIRQELFVLKDKMEDFLQKRDYDVRHEDIFQLSQQMRTMTSKLEQIEHSMSESLVDHG